MAAAKPGARRAKTQRKGPVARPRPAPRAGGRAARHLKRVRAICLSFPDATEKEAWGAPTFRVRERLFAMFSNDHHGDGRIALWCLAPAGAQAAVVAAEPERFFVPAYVGPSGWIGVDLERNGDAEVAYFAHQGWQEAVARGPSRSRRATPRRRGR